MSKILYTTHNDLVARRFEAWEIRFYDEPDSETTGEIVYLRDPFNDPNWPADAAIVDGIIARQKNAYLVDQITSFKQIYDIEDKYLQSVKFKQFCPKTWLPSEGKFIPGRTLAKPRVSSRAKNIVFELGNQKLDDRWIIQELLDIREELRVFVIDGDIVPTAGIKTSKASGHVKMVGARELTVNEINFIKRAMANCDLDFVGLDVAILAGGSLKLIEVNRSPQFRRYFELTGINPAEILTQKLQAKLV